jgi:hypothetical protein
MHIQDSVNGGRWVTAGRYARLHDLSVQTLANWRHQDKVLGRNSARPGYPTYRRYGGAVRYLLPPEEQPEQAA